MRFRNSLRLLMANFKQVYKLLLAKLIIGLITTALCCAFVLPELLEIWNSTAMQGLLTNVKGFVSVLFKGNPTELEEVKNAIIGESGSISQVLSLLSSMTVELVWTLVGCILVYILKRFAETCCYFTVGSVLNDKMGTYAETPFFTSFVANLGKACVYAAVYVPLIFLFDVLTLGVVYLILSFVSILPALFLSMTTIVLLQALKLTFTSPWLPGMTADNKKIGEAMKCDDNIEKKQTVKFFGGYVVSVYFIIIVNVVGALCTFGSALLITVPASYFFLICMQYVNYYTVKGKKYFLTYENIATNPDHGDSEHFFNYIGEEEKQKDENNDK